MLKQRLQQKLQQKLSPQQIQMIKLLELPTMQLEQRIKSELEENPLLEEGQVTDETTPEEPDNNEAAPESDDEFSVEDYYDDDEYIPSYRLTSNNYPAESRKAEIPFSVGSSFHEYLENQLGELSLTEKELTLAVYLIGNLDEDGYLRRSIEAIVDDIAFSQNITTSVPELLTVLKTIQELEPVGIGARDLRECLLLQIENKDLGQPAIQLARMILLNQFEEFSKKHYDKITQRLSVTDLQLKAALDEILKLNPKPGSGYSDPAGKATEQIMPDFMLEYKDGEFVLTLNSRNIPELRLNRSYSDIIGPASDKEKGKELAGFLRQKMDSARWFIEALKQRENTLIYTMKAILERQHEYFLEGDERKLRPMILKDIADATSLDISTISRVANSKYIQTHFGIFPLKHFFSEGMQNASGEEVSTREIKEILQECVAAEDKRKPVTDDELASILKEKGYPIARRTVAKYREQLSIPVGRLRKELQ